MSEGLAAEVQVRAALEGRSLSGMCARLVEVGLAPGGVSLPPLRLPPEVKVEIWNKDDVWAAPVPERVLVAPQLGGKVWKGPDPRGGAK